jgi:hypothetical protein
VNVVLYLALALLQLGSPDAFSIRGNLQALYDEISQTTLRLGSESDVDQYHQVFHSLDWTFVDPAGKPHAWPETREQMVRALTEPRPEWMLASIDKMSLVQGGANVAVTVTTRRTIVDQEGKYGPNGGSHTITETTRFRDAWVSVDGQWKQKSREQVGQPKVAVDRPRSDD